MFPTAFDVSSELFQVAIRRGWIIPTADGGWELTAAGQVALSRTPGLVDVGLEPTLPVPVLM